MDPGKEQVELFDDYRKRGLSRLRRPSLPTVVFIVVTIVLASLSISLSGLAKHYHDSKYRSQYWLVVSLSEQISVAEGSLVFAVDSSEPFETRYGNAVRAEAILDNAEDIVYSIRLMYPDDSKESAAFGAVSGAIATSCMSAERIANRYSDAIAHNETYEFNSTVTALVSNITGFMDDLRDLIDAGVRSGTDFLENPYSIVKGMDLEALISVSNQLWWVSRELNEMV